jgi:hypothetical protein
MIRLGYAGIGQSLKKLPYLPVHVTCQGLTPFPCNLLSLHHCRENSNMDKTIKEAKRSLDLGNDGFRRLNPFYGWEGMKGLHSSRGCGILILPNREKIFVGEQGAHEGA